jgi:hypothetical protein
MKFAVLIVFAALALIMVQAPALSSSSKGCSIAATTQMQGEETRLKNDLNAATAMVTASLNTEEQAMFGKTDLAWHVYMEEACGLVATRDVGHGMSKAGLQCKISMLRERVATVSQLLPTEG